MQYDEGIADSMFNLLVSPEAYNRDLARLQRDAYPMEYHVATDNLAMLNRSICERVKQLVADTVFQKEEQTPKNPAYRQAFFTRHTTMLQLEIASYEAHRNLSLMFYHCVPSGDAGQQTYNDIDRYTGGRYEVGAYYTVNYLPTWLRVNYDIFSHDKNTAERSAIKLRDFKIKLGEILTSFAQKFRQYTLLQEITDRIAPKK